MGWSLSSDQKSLLSYAKILLLRGLLGDLIVLQSWEHIKLSRILLMTEPWFPWDFVVGQGRQFSFFCCFNVPIYHHFHIAIMFSAMFPWTYTNIICFGTVDQDLPMLQILWSQENLLVCHFHPSTSRKMGGYPGYPQLSSIFRHTQISYCWLLYIAPFYLHYIQIPFIHHFCCFNTHDIVDDIIYSHYSR
jgi:hypothetical protein